MPTERCLPPTPSHGHARRAETTPAHHPLGAPIHCTGWDASRAIATRLPDAFIQNSVGTRYELAAAT